MKGTVTGIFVTSAVFAFMALSSYGETIKIEELVGEFDHATDVQKVQLEKHYKYEKMPASGVIKNVEPWNVFDMRVDKGTSYYRVVTEPKKTGAGVPYEIVIFYKDKNRVRLLNKGQDIQADGTFLRLVDQRLIYSVWIYGEELTPEDKELFK